MGLKKITCSLFSQQVCLSQCSASPTPSVTDGGDKETSAEGPNLPLNIPVPIQGETPAGREDPNAFEPETGPLDPMALVGIGRR